MVFAPLLLLAAVLLGVFLLQRAGAKGRSVAAASLAGASVFPIVALDARWGWLGNVRFRHSFASQVAIDADGLHFQAMGARHLAFAAIERVEVQQKWNGLALLFVGSEWGHRLTITLTGEDGVRAVLRALPRGLSLSPRAAALRGAAMEV